LAVLALCNAYSALTQFWFFEPFCNGVAFAALGLLGATCIRGVMGARRSPSALAILLLTAVLVGPLQLGLVPVVLCMAPISIFLVGKDHAHTV